MNRNAVASTIIAIVALACVPVLWRFATEAIPPLSEIQAQASGNRFGPWVFTWALVWVGCVAALGVAGLALSSARLANTGPVSTKPAGEQV
jgi:hypothetical protein